MPATSGVVGSVTALYRYPVKSMRGEAVESSHVWWPGLDGDRRWAFVRSGNLSTFPWLTGRDVPTLLRYTPYFVDPGDVARSPIRVRTPAGEDLALESEALAGELAAQHGGPIHLLHLGTGTFDSIGISVLSVATVDGLSGMVGAPLDVRRFRPNIVVAPTTGTAFAEDDWLDGVLTFGESPEAAQIRASIAIERCMMVNLDPDTAVQNPAVLRTVLHAHAQCTSVGCTTLRPGTIRVGDPIHFTPGL